MTYGVYIFGSQSKGHIQSWLSGLQGQVRPDGMNDQFWYFLKFRQYEILNI